MKPYVRVGAACAFLALAACGGGGSSGPGNSGGGPSSPPPPVSPPPPLSPEMLSVTGSVQAAVGDVMIYTPDPQVIESESRVHNVATGVEAVLQNADRMSISQSSLTPEWIYGFYRTRPATGCTPNCVLRWPITGGEPTLLPRDSVGQPFKIVATGRYAAWLNDAGDTTLTLHDAVAGTTENAIIIQTPGAQILAFDLTLVAGEPVIYYWAGPSAAGRAVRDVDLFRWEEATGSQLVEAFDSTNSPTGVDPKFVPQVSTDGSHVAYNVWTPTGASPASISTVIRPIAGGAATTVGTRPAQLLMRNGVLVWYENFPTSGAISGAAVDTRAWSAARGAETLQTANPWLGDLRLAPGFAVYGSASGGETSLYSWNAATGAKAKLTNQPTLNYYATTGWVYYYDDSRPNNIYRVRLGGSASSQP